MSTYEHAHGTLGAMDLLQITCPRCAESAEVRFYGPCDACREALQETMRKDTPVDGDGGSSVAYEPKMNVVPNQVATKE